MSITKETQVTIWCDAESQCNEFMADVSTATELRKYMHSSGWVTVGGKDFCPRHAALNGPSK